MKRSTDRRASQIDRRAGGEIFLPRFPAFLIAVALAGCDAAPGAGLAPFPSDGVSGFGKPALVDVCIGSARVVPGEATAVCVPDGAAFAACASDLECEGAERCLCGRCFVRACDEGTVCPAGEACRGGRCTPGCTQDSDCEPGETCSGGGCALPCEADADCRRGEVCDFFGTCAAEPCSPITACGAGYTCEPVTVSGEVREPAISLVGAEPIAFFELRSPTGSAVYRARFEDALHLVADPETPVLAPPAGGSRVGAPSPIVAGDQVDLLVAVEDGAAIGLARSTDAGRSFAWISETILTPAEPWEAGSIGSPAAFERDGRAHFFYEGGPGAGIGLAALDGPAAERLAAGPVLRPADLEDASFWRSVQSIGSPFALVSGGAVRVYVTARGTEGGTATTPAGSVPPEPNDSIGMLATTDLASFDRYPGGPVFATVSGLFGAIGEREPAVVLTGEGAELYFVATDASGAEVSGLSRASTVK